MIIDDDETDGNAFRAEMAKSRVKPLKKRQEKVKLRPVPQNVNVTVRRRAATSDLSQDNDPQYYSGIEWLGPHDVAEYKKDGIQHEVFKNLKQGRYEIGADLDLHSYRVEEARTALFQFVKECVDHEIRYALIIHGKGWHGQRDSVDEEEEIKGKPRSRIKSYIVHWLKTMDSVLAFSSAQAKDGGTGSLYVLFRKSEKAKEKNCGLFHSEKD